jgi:hypothetical protein
MYGMMGGMEKTTVYLTSEQKAALARAAEVEGRSEARLIRAGIEAVTARHRVGESRIAAPDGDLRASPGGPSLERPRWIEREDFAKHILGAGADPGLRSELLDIAPGTTDDEPIP